MSDKFMVYIIRIKMAIYIALFIALLIKAIMFMAPIEAKEVKINTQNFFWPPDMVPHPMPPEPEKDRDWA